MEKALKILLLVLLIVSLLATFIVFKNRDEGEKINIYINSELYETVDLNEVSSPYTISLPHNTLLVESDGVSVIDADCPDKVCIKRGKMRSGVPIICAPNALYISCEREAHAVSW